MQSLIDKFEDDMFKQHRERIERGYNAHAIERSLENIGGYQTAKKFLPNTLKPKQGFMNLVERNLLDYSIESLVIQPKYASLFTDKERDICRKLLEMYGYIGGKQQATNIMEVKTVADTLQAAEKSLPYTPQQQALFDFVQRGKGNGIINAVAGSGKTTTILECSKFIPADTKALFCAFNRSIAKEIRSKLKSRGVSSVAAKTIHGLGYNMLIRNIGDIFSIQDDKYQKILHSEDMQDNLSDHYENLLQFSNDKKNGIYMVNDCLLELINKFRLVAVKTHEDIEALEIKELIEEYNILQRQGVADFQVQEYSDMLYILLKHGNEQAKEQNIIDFTDMIYLPYIWNLQPQQKADFLFVDECQDLSRAQLLTAMKFIGDNSRVVAVGDPYQAINGFAGADTQSFARVKKSFGAKLFPLTVCFRCPEECIEMAQKYCAYIKGTNKAGKVTSIKYYQIHELAKAGDLIISRKKEPLTKLMFTLIDKGIKVYIREDDARDIVAKLRKLFRPSEMSIDFNKDNRIMTDVCNDVIERNLFRITKEIERKPLSNDNKKIAIAIREKYLRANVAFIEKLYYAWKSNTIKALLTRLFEDITAQNDSIRLSTIHCAKGLENDKVFILDYDLLPLFKQGMLKWQEEQERNLVYVALTRAKKELFLIDSEDGDAVKHKGTLFNIFPEIE